MTNVNCTTEKYLQIWKILMGPFKRGEGKDKMKVLNFYHREHNGPTLSESMIIYFMNL